MKDKTLSEKRSSFKEYFKQNYLLYVLLLPLIVYLLIFSYYPMLGIQIAFKDWRIRGGIWGSPWVEGNPFKWFIEIFKVPKFATAIWNTVYINLIGILINAPIM